MEGVFCLMKFTLFDHFYFFQGGKVSWSSSVSVSFPLFDIWLLLRKTKLQNWTTKTLPLTFSVMMSKHKKAVACLGPGLLLVTALPSLSFSGEWEDQNLHTTDTLAQWQSEFMYIFMIFRKKKWKRSARDCVYICFKLGSKKEKKQKVTEK